MASSLIMQNRDRHRNESSVQQKSVVDTERCGEVPYLHLKREWGSLAPESWATG